MRCNDRFYYGFRRGETRHTVVRWEIIFVGLVSDAWNKTAYGCAMRNYGWWMGVRCLKQYTYGCVMRNNCGISVRWHVECWIIIIYECRSRWSFFNHLLNFLTNNNLDTICLLHWHLCKSEVWLKLNVNTHVNLKYHCPFFPLQRMGMILRTLVFGLNITLTLIFNFTVLLFYHALRVFLV
jgi:hypothetical protein